MGRRFGQSPDNIIENNFSQKIAAVRRRRRSGAAEVILPDPIKVYDQLLLIHFL